MSGGHFDYAYHRIEEMADGLKTYLNISEKDDWRHFSPETLQRLRRCEELLHQAAEIAHDVEWLFSGDYGEETFVKKVDEYLPPFQPVPQEICGLCHQPILDGQDCKVPHPIHWPGERQSDTDVVHVDCENEESRRAHAQLTDKERERFLRSL